MSAWLKRFGLHLAAAVGATGIFVAAAAVGASQTRQQVIVGEATVPAVRTRAPTAERKPTVVVVTPTPAPAANAPTATSQAPASQPTAAPQATPDANPGVSAVAPQPDSQQPQTQPQQPATARPKPQATPRTAPPATPAPAADKVVPERSLAGSIREVQPDALVVLGVGGREWHVIPAPGALIRLNGKPARLDALQAGDNVVILGQAQPGPGARFLAHAITAKSK